MPPSAVIFEFDGVLSDVENVHVVAWQRALTKLGWEIPDEVAAGAAAMGDRAFAAELFARRGIDDADLDGWIREKQALAATMIGLNPRAFPGATAFVDALSDRARMVAVAADQGEIAAAFHAAVWPTEPPFVVIGRGGAEPEVDLYRLALDVMGVAAADAVAVVASPEGVAAAEAAGLRRVAVGHRLEAGEWSAGATFIPALEPLADALAAIGFDDRSAS